jgi:two-component system response regulator AtoC
MRKGAYDFITKPIDYAKLSSTVKNALESATLKKEIAYYKEREEKEFALSKIVAESGQMKSVLEMVRKIAVSETSIVLLQGESGTGKDVMAHAIHGLSRRKEAPFLAVNCSAIPENLLESELFGFEKGAFTDAKQQKKGLVETAEGGTVFFDEIGTLGFHLQAKLLRFLETQAFKRVGGLKDIEVDIRVLAATNQDLERSVREGKFRSDLFYRLNVCPISLPSLRERKEDILPLVNHFIGHFNIKFRKNISGLAPEAEKALIQHEWPGNVRELRNAVERAMIFEEGPVIHLQHLPIPLGKVSEPAARPIGGPAQGKILSLPEMEKALILKALKESGRNQSRAALLLDISRDTLRYKIKKFKIKPEDVG